MRARRRHKTTRADRTRIMQTHEFIAPPPAEVIAEREAACQAPQSITAIVFGDPPPGRSALDRRMRT